MTRADRIRLRIQGRGEDTGTYGSEASYVLCLMVFGSACWCLWRFAPGFVLLMARDVPQSAIPVWAVAVGLAARAVSGTRRRQPAPFAGVSRVGDARDPGRMTHYLGTVADGGRDAWLPVDAMRRHVLVVGDDATRRQRMHVTLLGDSLSLSSGCILALAPGDGLVERVAALASACGRQDDLEVLPVGSLVGTPFAQVLATCPAAFIEEVVLAVLRDREGSSHVGRSGSLLGAVAAVLVHERDHGRLTLDEDALADCLAWDGLHGWMGGSSPHGPTPDQRDAIRRYLTGLPGYDPALEAGQSRATRDHHGYDQHMLMGALSSLREGGRHAGDPRRLVDAILGRRILVVPLPDGEGVAPRTAADVFRRSLESALARVTAMPDVVHGARDAVPVTIVVDAPGVLDEGWTGALRSQARMAGVSMVHGVRSIGSSHMDALAFGVVAMLGEEPGTRSGSVASCGGVAKSAPRRTVVRVPVRSTSSRPGGRPASSSCRATLPWRRHPTATVRRTRGRTRSRPIWPRSWSPPWPFPCHVSSCSPARTPTGRPVSSGWLGAGSNGSAGSGPSWPSRRASERV